MREPARLAQLAAGEGTPRQAGSDGGALTRAGRLLPFWLNRLCSVAQSVIARAGGLRTGPSGRAREPALALSVSRSVLGR
jgi:hypothetical protein